MNDPLSRLPGADALVAKLRVAHPQIYADLNAGIVRALARNQIATRVNAIQSLKGVFGPSYRMPAFKRLTASDQGQEMTQKLKDWDPHLLLEMLKNRKADAYLDPLVFLWRTAEKSLVPDVGVPAYRALPPTDKQRIYEQLAAGNREQNALASAILASGI